jgi:CRISPR-associated protein Cmr4
MASKTYQPLVFRLQALTNLHPGGGDSFYGAVDKLVQRDPTTLHPTIHSHSLKGALREYFESELGLGKKDAFVTHVFGSAIGTDKKTDGFSQGQFRFFSADLLAIPVPDENLNSSTAFNLETEEAVWEQFSEKVKHLGGSKWDAVKLKTAFQNGISPNFQTTAGKLKNASEELPVIARNQLENGESQNLWYEELVPHQSIFGFVVQVPSSSENKDELNNKIAFTSALNGKVVQIGANATVGYGYCLLTLLNPPA